MCIATSSNSDTYINRWWLLITIEPLYDSKYIQVTDCDKHKQSKLWIHFRRRVFSSWIAKGAALGKGIETLSTPFAIDRSCAGVMPCCVSPCTSVFCTKFGLFSIYDQYTLSTRLWLSFLFCLILSLFGCSFNGVLSTCFEECYTHFVRKQHTARYNNFMIVACHSNETHWIQQLIITIINGRHRNTIVWRRRT